MGELSPAELAIIVIYFATLLVSRGLRKRRWYTLSNVTMHAALWSAVLLFTFYLMIGAWGTALLWLVAFGSAGAIIVHRHRHPDTFDDRSQP